MTILSTYFKHHGYYAPFHINVQSLNDWITSGVEPGNFSKWKLLLDENMERFQHREKSKDSVEFLCSKYIWATNFGFSWSIRKTPKSSIPFSILHNTWQKLSQTCDTANIGSIIWIQRCCGRKGYHSRLKRAILDSVFIMYNAVLNSCDFTSGVWELRVIVEFSWLRITSDNIQNDNQ